MVFVRPLASICTLAALLTCTQGQELDGRELYLEQCASCHGVDLEGQPDWMARLPNGRLPAPPHDETGHTWHHSDRQLFRIIKEGLASIVPGYETDMPAFADTMTDDEIRSVLDYIKGTWPERQTDYQRAKSQADGE
ncbi:putative bifunctional cbb3-type cytochrome c oxidase subunit II/cytochrome c [Devosia sp. LC5]|nr:putative bifunctional cbb3-type cytochrome c oxidase subunit II/cytochrome c [Devosia sp. LC5]